MDNETIYNTLRFGSTEEIIQLFQQAPPHPMKDVFLSLITSNEPGMVVLAATNLAMAYCYGASANFGADLAFAAHKMAVEVYLSENNHGGLIKTTLSILALQTVNALNLLGRSQEVIDFTERWAPFYKTEVEEHENLSSILTARANALLNLQRMEEAQAILVDDSIEWSAASEIERTRLLNNINRLKGSVTSIVKEQDIDMNKVISESLQHMAAGISEKNIGLDHLANLLGDKNQQTNYDDPAQFESALQTLKSAENFITKGNTDDNVWTVQQKVREASKIFKLYAQPEPSLIQQSLHELQEALAWAKDNKHSEITNDALWGSYLCHSRMGEISLASDALIQLRNELEKLRDCIHDPLKRGGAFSTYPYLFNALCEKLHGAGRFADLLEAIESAKGRAIADLLTQQGTSVVKDIDIYSAVSDLPDLVQRHQFHYLTFFLDELDEQYIAYGILVDKSGEVRSGNATKIARDVFDTALLHLNPTFWGQPSIVDPSEILPDASKVLAPFIQLIECFLDNGIMETGDHLVISGDAQLNNVPWHYLPCKNKLLVDWLSTSRVHNALQLKVILARPPVRYTQVFGGVLPRARDIRRGNWKTFGANLNKPIHWLLEFVSSKNLQLIENEQMTLQAICAADLENKIVHFSTHGFFPAQYAGGDPYHASGTLLSDGAQLPTDEQTTLPEFLLTPEKLLKYKIDFTNSHVSFMACVSGLSREGIGGDALGLDWAVIQAGASSMLSSHWDVSASHAADFFITFYTNWLVKRQPRGQAVRNTMLALKETHPSTGWAALCLSGDWR